jgi:hypothetical protein
MARTCACDGQQPSTANGGQGGGIYLGHGELDTSGLGGLQASHRASEHTIGREIARSFWGNALHERIPSGCVTVAETG